MIFEELEKCWYSKSPERRLEMEAVDRARRSFEATFRLHSELKHKGMCFDKWLKGIPSYTPTGFCCCCFSKFHYFLDKSPGLRLIPLITGVISPSVSCTVSSCSPVWNAGPPISQTDVDSQPCTYYLCDLAQATIWASETICKNVLHLTFTLKVAVRNKWDNFGKCLDHRRRSIFVWFLTCYSLLRPIHLH